MRLPEQPSVRTRVFRTLLLAAVGAFAGFEWARYTLDAELLDKSHLGGLYATAGAAILILGYRVFAVGRFVVREMLRERRGPDVGSKGDGPQP